jgi:LPS sulfotransferase NodH
VTQPAPSLTYVICTAPRTGSTLLGEALSATDRAGKPREYFDTTPVNEQHWVKQLGIRSDAEYVDKVVAAATTANGICGLKIHLHQLDVFRSKLVRGLHAVAEPDGAAAAGLMRARFGEMRYLWVRRRNKVAQAISYYRASRTGLWRSYDPVREDHQQASEVEFNYAEIDRLTKLCIQFDRSWEGHFRRQAIKPLVLVYEDFVEGYEQTIHKVMQFIGAEFEGPVTPPRLEKQADGLSAEWQRRYQAISSEQQAAGGASDVAVASSAGPTSTTVLPRRALVASPGTRSCQSTEAPLLSEGVPTSLAYLVCTEARTGSTLLCDALGSTGVAGRPDEYFNAGQFEADRWIWRLGITDPADYVDAVIRKTTTPNGIFGTKVHWGQVRLFHEKLLAANRDAVPHVKPDFERLLRHKFPALRYVWLRRRNKVAQAISYYRATQTAIWRSVKGRRDQDSVVDRALEFDFDRIDRQVAAVRESDWRWDDYFWRHRVTPLMVVYEDMIANLDVTVRGILQFIGVPDEGIVVAQPELERQADARSLEWEQRYVEMAAARAATAARSARSAPSNSAQTPATDVVSGVGIASSAADRPASRRAERRAAARRPEASDDAAIVQVVAYATDLSHRVPLVTAPVARDWMDATTNRFAYRCLPMLIANQAGWLVLNTQRLSVIWDGGEGLDALRIEPLAVDSSRHAKSHFGGGILTWTVPYLFRTQPGWNLHVRGPSNWPKDGICALEGIVETDWTEATFTMNWKLTRANHPITFEENEPIAMIVPRRRGELEQVRPEIRDISADPALHEAYRRWTRSRGDFNRDLRRTGSDAQKAGWQRHYMHGRSVEQEPAPEHQSKLVLREFDGRRSE